MIKTRRWSAVVLLFLLETAIILSSPVRADVPDVPAQTPGTLVIDPGHGGLDGGASAPDGTAESGLNLSISLRLASLARLFGVPIVLTREGESPDYPAEITGIREKKIWDQRSRVDLINGIGNGILISVHQNTYPDPRPSGTAVLYGSVPDSDLLALRLQQNLIAQLCPENRRVAAPIPDQIYLMKHVRCPAVLVECGFLSNPAEAEKLKTDRYQTQIALVMIATYLQFTG